MLRYGKNFLDFSCIDLSDGNYTSNDSFNYGEFNYVNAEQLAFPVALSILILFFTFLIFILIYLCC